MGFMIKFWDCEYGTTSGERQIPARLCSVYWTQPRKCREWRHQILVIIFYSFTAIVRALLATVYF